MDDFEPTKSLIGKGQFGEVYKIVSKIDKKEYAIKYINIDPHNATKDIQKSFMRELFILYHLKHPAIVQFKGGNLNSSDNPTVFHPSIVTEYLPNGSLNDFINNTKLNSTQKLIILLGISSAMKYVHKENVIHRDLKPDNILLDKNLYPRICDFGLSRFFDTSSKQAKTIEMSFMIGTPLYFSPEKMKDGHVYGPSSDVYAFSLIAYFVVTGLSPFYEQKFLNIFNLFNYVYEQKGRPQFLDDTVSEKMKLLLSRCWDHEPLKRPNFDEIFHELSTDFSYFNDEIDKEKVEEYLRILHEEVYDYPNDLATQNAQLKINVDNLNKEIKEILKKQESFSSVNEDGINLLNVLYKYVSNKKETIDILTNMSSNGNSCASYLLGLINEKISGNKINFTQIQPFYEKTSEQGNSFGYFRLGCLYNKIENFEKAIEFFVNCKRNILKL